MADGTRYFAVMRVWGRPAYTEVTMRTLARTTNIADMRLHVLYTETEQFSRAQMEAMAWRSALPVHSWSSCEGDIRIAVRTAQMYCWAAVDCFGYPYCLWIENDVVFNSEWLCVLTELYETARDDPDEPYKIGYAHPSNHYPPSIATHERQGRYVLRHRTGAVALLMAAEHVKRISPFDDWWENGPDMTDYTMCCLLNTEGFWHIHPWKSVAQHVGRSGLSTMTEERFQHTQGRNWHPDPHVVEALDWLTAHEGAEAPTWLEE